MGDRAGSHRFKVIRGIKKIQIKGKNKRNKKIKENKITIFFFRNTFFKNNKNYLCRRNCCADGSS
jgi:hypothetical protein